jgi:diadenosine tetraphosphate (Ap4A) HIT family hydrolase
MTECYPCRLLAAFETGPPRERIWSDGRWRVARAFDSALPGWLVVVPIRHIESLSELTPEEAAPLGPLLAALSRALVEVTGCEKTYLMLFAEGEGFHHLHIHVVPRHADIPDDHRATRVFGYLGRPESEWVSASEMGRIGAEVARRITL